MPRQPTGRPPGRPRKTEPETAPPAAGAVLDEGEICQECWPDGWPTGQIGTSCSHGQWYRDESARPWTIPTSVTESGAIALRPTIPQIAIVIAKLTDTELGDLLTAVQRIKETGLIEIPGTDLTDPSLQE